MNFYLKVVQLIILDQGKMIVVLKVLDDPPRLLMIEHLIHKDFANLLNKLIKKKKNIFN
jgi:hypothetical protein